MSDERETDVMRRTLDTDAEEPAAEVAVAVADLEGTDVTALSDMYSCVDNVLDHLFSNPPSPDARMEVTFSYEGYRITVEQDGTARFLETA
ncbi:HalOD1 output domain-containing protein [Halosimplex aquaticum]|uniref:HalOD1 output domain-containing protein n=1 Tax=Halosimplex aquaticum TaxID=3026162 RepID=A0ABD5XTE7_9EURY|nr:HalOD1 output domain-containing protein [Halosimplex aquaticum]